ncbi:MAG: peptidylprolyl isomerase [Oligoflexales bacterium]
MQQVRVRHIQVDSLILLQSIRLELDAGRYFEDLAQQYSTCPSGARGGCLEWFDPESSGFLKDSSLEAGDFLGPIHTGFGYHLVEVLDVIDDGVNQQAS